MNGQERLSIIAFIVSMCVIIGFAIVFSILFGLYGHYKIRHIKLGHEDDKLESSLKRKYRYVLEKPKIEEKIKDVEVSVLNYDLVQNEPHIKTFLRRDLKKKIKNAKVDEPIGVYESILIDKKRNKKYQIIMNTLFGILYCVLLIIFGFALGFKLGGEQLFFGNTTLLTIRTGSMETVNNENNYIEEHNLTNQIEQYSLIGIDKIYSENDIKLYDILAYKSESGSIIVHRVIRIYQNEETNVTYYTLRGDANDTSSAEELTLTFDKVVGKYNGFQNYGLGVTLIYLQSNIGLVALAASFLFLITYNVAEGLIEKTYDNKILELSKKIDEDYNISFQLKEDTNNVV